MRAAVFHRPGLITVDERPDPRVLEPTDAVVRVVRGCVCGSDLWYWRGLSERGPGSIGHEFIGVVEEIGSAIDGLRPGMLVIAPFAFADLACPNCQWGATVNCVHGGLFGDGTIDGGQGEAVRVPLAETTLVPVPGTSWSDAELASFLALSDVMPTGHHAAVSAGVTKGSTVAVIGDGAVGLSAVLAAHRLGAERIVALSSHADRQVVARAFGATDIVAQRGAEAVATVLEMTGGIGADAVLECVGTQEAMETAAAIARPGSIVGGVGVPHGVMPATALFGRNVGWRGGPAPVRIYLPELLEDVLGGTIDPGRVFTYETDLDGVVEAYRAMDERRAIKSILRVSEP
ncbi:Alcohol dehydrogenase GroES domain protein [Acidimicrobium ferrooxidans DSM 10331]|uniref:Alcohol dehydrogenase GroES domain protein n=1 Tax=Acidimicrobium ferrooxidans (strain DSM 10331 / JCM 15462 / NBRC 103882 / ICP) TaxID=525909 RepID=C7M2J0_ACIFD|nr:zinc-dependent alcohol dehydrogenase family protein [Acidimicrobium ferrooxidans]ACU53234.1 Alcohol dehydrogenase GroES domain protein [Acidimicrobium ferrooxidans DSM 10331]